MGNGEKEGLDGRSSTDLIGDFVPQREIKESVQSELPDRERE